MNIIKHQHWPDGTRVQFTEEARQKLTQPLGPVGQVYTITNTDNSHHDVILRETGQRFGVYWLQAEAEAETDTRSPAADRQSVARTPDADQDAWIQTFTGKAFPLLNPKPEDIDIVDIARALSMQCRFNGHVKTFYSVAEHCVLMSEAVAPKRALWALLHDASEAYVGDVVTPLKNHLPNYRSIEDRIMAVIAQKFSLDDVPPPEVKDADTRILLTERAALLSAPAGDWGIDGEPLDVTILGLDPAAAEKAYLRRFTALTRVPVAA